MQAENMKHKTRIIRILDLNQLYIIFTSINWSDNCQVLYFYPKTIMDSVFALL